MGTSAANFFLWVAAPVWLPLSAINDGLHNASAAYINFVATKLPFAENDSKAVKALKFLGGVAQPVLMPFAALWWKGTGTPLVVWEMLEKAKEHNEPPGHAPEQPPVTAPTPSGPAIAPTGPSSTAPTGPTSSLAPAGAGGLGAANVLAPLAAVLTLAAGGLVWIQHQDAPTTSGPTPVVEPVQGTGNGVNQPAAAPGDPGPAAIPPIPALSAPIPAQSPSNQGGGAATDPATNGSGAAGTGGAGGSAAAPAMPASDPGHTGTLPGQPAPADGGEGVVSNPDPGGAGTPPIGPGGSAGPAPAMPGLQPAPNPADTGGGAQVAQAPAMPGPAPAGIGGNVGGTGADPIVCQSFEHSCPGGTDSIFPGDTGTTGTTGTTGGSTYTDPGTTGGSTYTDPGTTGGSTYTDPGTTGGSIYTDPGTTGGSTYTDPGTTGGSTYTDPGTTGGDTGTTTVRIPHNPIGPPIENLDDVENYDPGESTYTDIPVVTGSTDDSGYTDPATTGGDTSGSTYTDPSTIGDDG